MEKSYNLVLSGENPKKIDPSTAMSESFDVRYENGDLYNVQGIQVRYKNGLDRVLMKIVNSVANEVIMEATQLCQIGNRQDVAIPRDELPVNFFMATGTRLQVFLATDSETIEKKDVSVTLFGNRRKAK